MSWVAPVVSAASSGSAEAFTNIANASLSRKQNKHARDFSREMSLWAYNKDLEQWNRANEYNSPEAQMARLKQAGLNPRLMYGQGTTGNTTVTAPHMDTPKWTPIPMKFDAPKMNWLGDYLDFTVRSKQAELLNEQIDSQTIANIRNVVGMAYDYGNTDMLNEYLPDKLRNPSNVGNIMREQGYDQNTPGSQKGFKDYSLENLRQRNELVKEQIGNTIASRNFKEKTTEYLNNKLNVLNSKGYNVDKDSIVDRQLTEMFGDSASVGSAWGMQLLKMIMLALRGK